MGKGQRTSIGKETPRRKRSKASRTRHAADATLGVASSGAARATARDAGALTCGVMRVRGSISARGVGSAERRAWSLLSSSEARMLRRTSESERVLMCRHSCRQEHQTVRRQCKASEMIGVVAAAAVMATKLCNGRCAAAAPMMRSGAGVRHHRTHRHRGAATAHRSAYDANGGSGPREALLWRACISSAWSASVFTRFPLCASVMQYGELT